MSVTQVQSAVEPVELTTYEKKVVCSEIPAFVGILASTDLNLLEKADRVLNDGFTGNAFKAWALLVREYITFEETPESKAEIDQATSTISELQSIDFDSLLAQEIMDDPSKALELIQENAQYKSEIQDRINDATALIKQATTGAQRAAQIAFDRGLKYGELRDSPSQSTGNKHETLLPGIYKIMLGKEHLYKFLYDNPQAWALANENGDRIASYEQIKAMSDEPEFDPRVSSATRARKVAKVAKVGYRGYDGQDAIVVAFLAKFANMSAGNPSDKNWAMVQTKPFGWLNTEPATEPTTKTE